MRDPDEGVSDDGMISTGVDRRRVPPAFEPVIAAALEAVRREVDDTSVFLYGSVATGRARLGRSDVDLVGVGLRPEVAAELSTVLSTRFAALCRAVDIAAARPADYAGLSDEAYGNRVFLRHYCVRLAGGYPVQLADAYRADARAARGFNGDIALRARTWRERLADGGDPAGVGRRVARRTLFAVTGLVSVHQGTWTTDRVAAAERWAAVDPSLRQDLHRLVRWSEGIEQPDGADLKRALDGVVADVVGAFAELIGLWPGTPPSPGAGGAPPMA